MTVALSGRRAGGMWLRRPPSASHGLGLSQMRMVSASISFWTRIARLRRTTYAASTEAG